MARAIITKEIIHKIYEKVDQITALRDDADRRVSRLPVRNRRTVGEYDAEIFAYLFAIGLIPKAIREATQGKRQSVDKFIGKIDKEIAEIKKQQKSMPPAEHQTQKWKLNQAELRAYRSVRKICAPKNTNLRRNRTKLLENTRHNWRKAISKTR